MGWKDMFPKENRYFETENGILCNNDALEILKQMPDNCIDTVITDPPYGLSKYSEKTIREVLGKWLNGEEEYVPQKKGFMGKAWDAFVPPPALWKEVYRVMKPGGTILVFAGARTQDLMAMSLRLAGFEIKDTLMWLYGSGFPKATDISKRIDKIKGAEREVIGKARCGKNAMMGGLENKITTNGSYNITAPTTPEAKQWEGWKSHGLKPAYEPIIMAIKPNEGSYAENALKWGVAGLNIDGARIPYESTPNPATNPLYRKQAGYKMPERGKISNGAVSFTSSKNDVNVKGRFPANILLDEEAAKMLDEQSGESKSQCSARGGVTNNKIYGKFNPPTRYMCGYNDSGGASRFFYIAKASAKERNMGLEDFEDRTVDDGRKKPIDNPYQRGMTLRKNIHPTVKPLKLIEYLVKLTSMPNKNQIYLDPFLGSGTTAMACEKLQRKWLGIEINKEYCKIAEKRIKKVLSQNSLFNGKE